ncbi:hypothetical protein IWX49DRAFT_324614 [Phyllosticta citricarpa]|uniref:Zn(2)-C6 fungal-type domain-containing protein n=2 Tax=Phyllosticta TaxID=121621 RepID=A0ABR1L6E0_9PEZI
MPVLRTRSAKACDECHAQRQRCFPHPDKPTAPCLRCRELGLSCTPSRASNVQDRRGRFRDGSSPRSLSPPSSSHTPSTQSTVAVNTNAATTPQADMDAAPSPSHSANLPPTAVQGSAGVPPAPGTSSRPAASILRDETLARIRERHEPQLVLVALNRAGAINWDRFFALHGLPPHLAACLSLMLRGRPCNGNADFFALTMAMVGRGEGTTKEDQGQEGAGDGGENGGDTAAAPAGSTRTDQ